MREFSEKEEARLKKLNPRLVEVVREVNKIIPIFVVCTLRDKDEQDLAFSTGKSKVQYPKSRHNRSILMKREDMADAVDLCPYPIEWNNTKSFYDIYKAMMNVSAILGIKIRAGADFNQDGNLKNDKFIDLPHYELV